MTNLEIIFHNALGTVQYQLHIFFFITFNDDVDDDDL